jgi:hypothetical protein
MSHYRFFAQRLNIGDEILLVNAPDLDGNPAISAVKGGLKAILTQAYVVLISASSQPSEYGVPREQKGAKLCAHIWVEDLSLTADHARWSGKPRRWESLKRVFQNLVAMDSLVFLTTHWEKVDQESGEDIEERIRNEIWEVVPGDMFARLQEMNQIEASAAVQKVLELFTEPERTIRRRANEEKRSQQRVDYFLQPEMDRFSAQLEKTKDGKRIREAVHKILEEYCTSLPPLLEEMDKEDLQLNVKKRVARQNFEEEYGYFMREMTGFLQEAHACKIPVPPRIWEYYFGQPMKEVSSLRSLDFNL